MIIKDFASLVSVKTPVRSENDLLEVLVVAVGVLIYKVVIDVSGGLREGAGPVLTRWYVLRQHVEDFVARCHYLRAKVRLLVRYAVRVVALARLAHKGA